MTSRRVEDEHTSALEKLLLRSGIECIRSPPESTLSSTSSGVTEEQGPTGFEEEQKPEPEPIEEESIQLEEEISSEIPNVFPTPSLRKLLPEKIRKIQEQNRIHTLPEEFKTIIDPEAIPKIALTAQQTYIDILAELVGCKDYKSSLAEFWFLDTLANLLWRAQEDGLDRPTQVILILWFCEWIKEIQNFDAADRQRMLRRFQDNMLAAARFIAQEEHLPTPAEVGVHYKAIETTDSHHDTPKTLQGQSPSVYFEGIAYDCSMTDLAKIIHYIFDLFSSDYQFELIRSIFTASPDYTLLDAPYQLQNPKRLYAPLKIKPKKESKKETKPPKGKKTKDVETEEYLALMELKAKEQRELEEQEEFEREQWNRKSHILPLSFAVTEELFDKYWPPPPPEPEPEPVPEVKSRGKKK